MAFKNADMNLKEYHNKHCCHSKDFKPIWEGSPYMEDEWNDYGIQRGDLYTCNLCGLQILMIRFGKYDKRQSGLYEWKGSKTNFKYKALAFPLDYSVKLRNVIEV